MSTELTADQVREVLKPYAMLYLGKMCESYAAQAELMFMGIFRPQFRCNGDAEKDMACLDLELLEIEEVIRGIRSVDRVAKENDKEPKK